MTGAVFEVDLTPLRDRSGWTGLAVSYRAEIDPIPPGAPVLRLPKVIASVPGAAYAPDDIVTRDAAGQVALAERVGPSGPMGVYRHFLADRPVSGFLQVEVTAPVREVDRRTPVGPLFDLRREPLGLFGAGVSFIPVPVSQDRIFDFALRWHLAPGVTAVSSHGLGDVVQRWRGPVESIERCLFGAGQPVIAPAGPADVTVHAYSHVPFDLAALADYLTSIHAAMSAFFEDAKTGYRVLVRRNPDKGTGGTSFPSSFAFGYSPTTETDQSELRTLLAHEMVHNWPRLDEPWEVGSWYSEGAAEFYSLVLPWRAGLLDGAQVAAQLGRMYRRYDANPLRRLSNEAAAELFWADLRAQTLPYGRGLQYLVRVDGQLRAASQGRSSLDAIALDILRAQRRGRKVAVEDWLTRLEAVLGDRARLEYRQMAAGLAIPRPVEAFQGVFQPEPAAAVEHALGFDAASFNSRPRAVVGLVAGSAAERAGLREGDQLVTRRFSYASVEDGATPLELVVARDGAEAVIRYEPRGPTVPTTGWRFACPEGSR